MNATCRPFLREILGGAQLDAATMSHVAACAFCSARAVARERLLPALRQRPPMPAEARDLQAGIQARIVDGAERSPLGALLDAAMPVAMPADVADVGSDAAWSERLLQSETAPLSRTSPPSPSPMAWSRVRGQILGRIAAETVTSVRRRWLLGVASAAAITFVLLATTRSDDAVPKIVFRDLNAGDLAALGSIEFVVVRHGVPR